MFPCDFGRDGISIRPIPIGDPLPDIACHVILIMFKDILALLGLDVPGIIKPKSD